MTVLSIAAIVAAAIRAVFADSAVSGLSDGTNRTHVRRSHRVPRYLVVSRNPACSRS